jgi:PST family polysaccharide transporter
MLMLVMLAGAPLIVPLLYSPAFAPAAGIIAWQALGNVMKLAGWPVAFLSMARGRSGQFMALEVAWTSLYLGLVWLGLPALGLAVTGMAFAAACVVFLVLQTVVARVTFGFRWRRGTLLMIAGYCAAAGATLVASHHSATLQAVVGGVAALVLGGVSMKLIANRVGLEGGPFGVLAGLAARLKARRVGRTVAQS